MEASCFDDVVFQFGSFAMFAVLVSLNVQSCSRCAERCLPAPTCRIVFLCFVAFAALTCLIGGSRHVLVDSRGGVYILLCGGACP